jgi:hypothetical protein
MTYQESEVARPGPAGWLSGPGGVEALARRTGVVRFDAFSAPAAARPSSPTGRGCPRRSRG